MSEDRDTDSKTEEATEKKIHDAVERGDVPVSREVPILASLTAILIALLFIVPPRTEAFVGALMRFLDDAGGWRLERSNDVLALAEIGGLAAVEFVIPVVALLMQLTLIACAFGCCWICSTLALATKRAAPVATPPSSTFDVL